MNRLIIVVIIIRLCLHDNLLLFILTLLKMIQYFTRLDSFMDISRNCHSRVFEIKLNFLLWHRFLVGRKGPFVALLCCLVVMLMNLRNLSSGLLYV